MTEYETRMPDRREESRRRRLKARRRRKIRAALAGFLAVLTVAVGVLLWQRTRPLPGEGVAAPAYVTEKFLPLNRWSRPGTPLEEVNGVVIHYVGNPATSAEANRNYFASLSNGQENTFASSHFVVGLGGEVIQCIPLTEIAYASNDRNGDTVSIEVCHPDETGEFSEVTYERVVEITAWLCHTFELKPETEVIRHYDVTGKLCPLYYVEHPEAWEQLLADTETALRALGEQEG